MQRALLQTERTSKLGKLGETLAEERLAAAGFEAVRNLNQGTNFPFADIIAERLGQRYLIGVKTRNEFQASGKLNPCYNAVKLNDAMLRSLKSEGNSEAQITEIIWKEVDALAARWDALPAWIAIPVRPDQSTYSAYFGLTSIIRHRRSIPVQQSDRSNYTQLAPMGTFDARITRDLDNR